MPTTLRNKAPGPRYFNLAGGAQRLLQPGEHAELDLAPGAEQDPVLRGMIDRGEVEVLSGRAAAEAARLGNADPDALAAAQDRLAEAQAVVDRLVAARQAAEMDTARRTPPRQFGGDGGPEQMPTVDGHAGAPTPSQGDGTAEQRHLAAHGPAGATTRVSPPVQAPAPAPAAAPAAAEKPAPAARKA